MRILKSLNLIPKSHDLCFAVISDLVDRWRFINTLTVLEDRNEKLLCRKVCHGFGFPYLNGVEKLKRRALIDSLIIYAKLIGNRSTRLIIKNSVNLLEMRVCDFLGVLRDLDLRNNTTVLFNCYKLIDTAENRI